jgi:hypothetical protein
MVLEAQGVWFWRHKVYGPTLAMAFLLSVCLVSFLIKPPGFCHGGSTLMTISNLDNLPKAPLPNITLLIVHDADKPQHEFWGTNHFQTIVVLKIYFILRMFGIVLCSKFI